MPPSWTSYVSVDDVDAASVRVTDAGGKIIVPATDIPTVGRFSLKAGDAPVGGIMTSPKAEIPAMWLPYIEVDDADAAIVRASNHGGEAKMPAMTVPGVGRFGVVADNRGAVSGLIQPERKD